MNICKCGCKQECNKRFVRGHQIRGKIPWNKGLTKEKSVSICECGCGELCKKRFRSGHNFKNRIVADGTIAKIIIARIHFYHPNWSLEQIDYYLEHKNDLNICECGCGLKCRFRFVHGHNNKKRC